MYAHGTMASICKFKNAKFVNIMLYIVINIIMQFGNSKNEAT